MTNDQLRKLCLGMLNDFYEDSEPHVLAQAWLAEHPEVTGETVHIRAACVINANRQWCVSGWDITGSPDDDEMYKNALQFSRVLENPDALHWIEADVPVPQVSKAQTIKGSVMKG